MDLGLDSRSYRPAIKPNPITASGTVLKLEKPQVQQSTMKNWFETF